MRLLKTISDKIPDESLIVTREASRAVLLDENDLLPLLCVTKKGYHKLPGGGIDEGESREGALRREVKEEVGSQIKITGEIGEIIEQRAKYNFKQVSYCYLGKITTKGNPQFTEGELAKGFRVIWLSLDDAIMQVENDKPNDYEGIFIQQRDLEFLKAAKKMLSIS